jgi:hypothetical protein
VIAGTATAVSNRVSRRQGERWAEKDAAEQAQYAQQQQQYAPPPPQYAPAPAPAPASDTDRIAALTQLGELHASGVLTDAEFELEKSKILAS